MEESPDSPGRAFQKGLFLTETSWRGAITWRTGKMDCDEKPQEKFFGMFPDIRGGAPFSCKWLASVVRFSVGADPFAESDEGRILSPPKRILGLGSASRKRSFFGSTENGADQQSSTLTGRPEVL